MSDKHEEDVSEWFEGSKVMRGSGNQFNNPMDVRQSRYHTEYAFALDCKSTRGKSISITREMIEKACDQARGERPGIPLRWYTTDRLDYDLDWIAVPMDEFLELKEAAEKWLRHQLSEKQSSH